jgi:hypothetical protein
MNLPAESGFYLLVKQVEGVENYCLVCLGFGPQHVYMFTPTNIEVNRNGTMNVLRNEVFLKYLETEGITELRGPIKEN